MSQKSKISQAHNHFSTSYQLFPILCIYPTKWNVFGIWNVEIMSFYAFHQIFLCLYWCSYKYDCRILLQRNVNNDLKINIYSSRNLSITESLQNWMNCHIHICGMKFVTCFYMPISLWYVCSCKMKHGDFAKILKFTGSFIQPLIFVMWEWIHGVLFHAKF